MALSEKDFQVLDAINRHEITTQRQLAAHAGISLGQVNYVLKSFLDKGLVKLGNFKKNPHKMVSYAYLLTPKGIEEKSKLAVGFVIRRLREYNDLRQVLRDRIADIKKQGISRIIVVGPEIIRGFVLSIINEEHKEMTLIGQCSTWSDLDNIDPATYDVALLFDDSGDSVRSISDDTGIPPKKLVPLW